LVQVPVVVERIIWRLGCQSGKRKETETAEPVVQADDHDALCSQGVVRIKCRAAMHHGPAMTGLPELSITRDKHEAFVRRAKQFLREWHVEECPVRFDVVAIDNVRGHVPVVRLHKDALRPEIRRPYLSRI
jgi:Holliday junction resolvase-like predicted endonuclease